MKKEIKRAISAFFALILIFAALPFSRAEAKSFPDVSQDDWFYDDVTELAKWEIINGYPDGTFDPNNTLSRGEFIHMAVMCCEGVWSDKPLANVHWAEIDWNALKDAGILEVSVYSGTDSGGNVKETMQPLFECTAAELNKPISRYEVAYIINGLLYSARFEKKMELKSADDSYASYISDHASMNKSYQAPVEQVFSKGIITGYEDASFRGDNSLTRAESAAIITRLFWSAKRKVQTFATEKEETVVMPGAVLISNPAQSFAFKYRNMDNASRRLALFGDPNKTHFTSAADAGNHITTITVKTWDINSAGAKYTREWALQVNTVVAEEVKGIFNYIYNDPEKFPIHSMGGARYSDTMRHSWGCAIDINPVENYYIHYASGQTVGSFCWKNGSSPYCITPTSSVVKAFALYGWGWGGQGWTSAADYMHFSILSSGG